MKNSKNIFTKLIFAIFFSIAAIFTACSDQNPLAPADDFSTYSQMPPSSITIEPFWENGFLLFKVINNSRDTIVNDFHVQFDPGVKITGYGVVTGWQIDPNTTDTANGKFGVKCGPQGQPIPPMGGAAIVVGVQLKFTGLTKKNPRHWWDFTWQATRDGIVVKEGKDAFPER
ncbi:MAG: hypothetical protein IT280_07210 [Ignavibacteria bacterium]|nr:hypothetical protein [Ignavibacteria bacterium]